MAFVLFCHLHNLQNTCSSQDEICIVADVFLLMMVLLVDEDFVHVHGGLVDVHNGLVDVHDGLVDLYIMVKCLFVCMFVTKNHHFLL